MLVLLVVLSLATPAYAAITGGTVSQFGTAYFKGANGAALTLDSVTLNSGGGMVAYALEPALVSTRADAVYETYAETNAEFLKGVNIIMQYGYPMNTPNLDEAEAVKADKARYATAVALQAWAVHCGAAATDGMIDYIQNPSSLTVMDAAHNSTLEFCKDLMARALSQTEMEHSISLNADTIKLEKNGDTYTAKVRVDITNCGGGYAVDPSALPRDSKVDGYTGRVSEILTITLPEDNANDSYTIKLYGMDMRTNDHHALYTTQGQSDVSKLVAMTEDVDAITASTVCEKTLVLSKTTGSPSASDTGGSSVVPDVVADIPTSAGATYVILDGHIVLYEKDAATLTPISGATFEVKNASGTVVMDTTKAVTGSNGAFSIEHLPTGKYTYQQKTTGSGYAIDPNTYNFNVIATPASTSYTGRVVTINDKTRVKVSVINGSGIAQEGATVEAWITDAESAAGSVVTGSDGKGELVSLQPGTYTLKVAKLESGSAEGAETKTVEITNAYVNSDKAITLSTKDSGTQTGVAEVIAVSSYLFPISLVGIGAGAGIRGILRRRDEEQ